MNAIRVIPLFLLLLVLEGCVSKAKQTDLWFASSHDIKSEHQVPQVPFIEQSAGHCGPATMAMAMQWAGQPVNVETLAREIYDPQMKGSLQTDLIRVGRQHGMMAVVIEGLPTLLSEIQSGHPVLVFENLALRWLPQWHYALVFGYDLREQVVVMHSGPEAFKHWDMRKFERSWMLGDYWGLVVLPPGEVATAAGEIANLTAAAGLEQIGQAQAAEKSYRRILETWPGSLGSLIGLGNLAFLKKQPQVAVDYLQQAVQAHPEAPVAWHNLAIAQGAAGMKEAAMRSAKRAVQLAPVAAKSMYLTDLKEWTRALN